MFDKTKRYAVKNRSAGVAVYSLPDFEKGVRRKFTAGEVKEISGEELQALSYTEGGQTLIDQFLLIEDVDAKAEVVTNSEPEYDLDEKGVYNLLVNGSADELEDCLNFGPEGVKDLIKSMAIKLPLNDLNKCEVIKNVLGYDITKVIAFNKEIAAEEAADGLTPTTKTRKAGKTANTATVTGTVKTRKVKKSAE